MAKRTDSSQIKSTISNKYMKECSTLLAIKEMQIKMTRRIHVTPVRIVFFQKTNNNKYGRGCGKRGHFTLVRGIQISVASMEISMEVPQKSKNITTI
jgi:hypothetical protein